MCRCGVVWLQVTVVALNTPAVAIPSLSHRNPKTTKDHQKGFHMTAATARKTNDVTCFMAIECDA